MEIELRMEEFKRIADKTTGNVEEIKSRMDEFEEVPKKVKKPKEKESDLPYGIRRYMPCPNCEEVMEIHEVKEQEAIYRCHHCNYELNLQYK